MIPSKRLCKTYSTQDAQKEHGYSHDCDNSYGHLDLRGLTISTVHEPCCMEAEDLAFSPDPGPLGNQRPESRPYNQANHINRVCT
jgi:hypothetical protein